MTNDIRAGHKARISYAVAKRFALTALALVAFLVACSSSSHDPSEDTQSVSEQVTGAPDLVVTATSISPAGVAPSQPATFSATVKNQGTVATPAGVIIGVAFAVDGTTVNWSDTDTQSLAPGQSITLTANSGPNSGASTWTAASGNHTLRAWVDDVNRIAESDETNNQLSVPLNIVSDLIVTSVTASPSSVAPGQPVTFSATVKNQGTNATPPGVIVGVA
ncbi:MAG TPA: CARDB domain-containing protein, partial [Polyangiaceae bacterium]|nr:CARDB domain-containing protein [Polyangiaceae bacterium]